MKFLNWLLYEVHRWLGIALAVFMFGWFFSGLVIMYSTPTTQTRSQQLAHAETLSPETGWLSLGEAWDKSAEQRKQQQAAHKAKPQASNAMQHGGGGETKPNGDIPLAIADARLVRSHGQPLWRVEDSRGQRYALSAIDGSLQQINAEQAIQIAKNWFKTGDHETPLAVSYIEALEKSGFLRNQDALSPFHHIAVGDHGDELLISARTGEVLHASTRADRAFYYAGNWIHLFKPLDALGWGDVRHDVQLWSGLGATIASLTGLIIGWIRWRPGFAGKKTYSEGRTQPYREFWFKWHFWSGLLGGTMALFWAFSGFIDTNPGKVFSNGDITKQELSRYQGSEIPEIVKNWQPASLGFNQAGDVVELVWRRLGTESVLLAVDRAGNRIPQAIEGTQPVFSEASQRAAVQRLVGDVQLASIEKLEQYDSYYYPRHNQGLVEKPLPVLLVQVADDAQTQLYIDPQDGRLLSKLDSSRRLLRWLYSALHHWDFGWLSYRPIWDLWMVTWVGLGLVLGGTSLVIGWKRLKKTFAPSKKRKTAARAVTTGKLATESSSG